MAMMKPLDDVLSDEWKRFRKGAQSLDPGFQGGPHTAGGHVVPGGQGGGQINIPGWDDVVKLGHGTAVGSDDFKQYFKDQKSGKPSTQDPAVAKTVARILASSDARKNSAQPGYSQAIGQMMTAVDNTQDLVATLATVGRLLIWAAPRAGLRFVPVVGWIVLAADILNTMNFIGMVASPLYAALCAGPRDALAAGIPAAVLKNALCKEVWTNARLNPFSRAARANRKLRSMGRLPGLSNIIELVQVTDTLFGYGMSFGALYGTAIEVLHAGTADIPFTNTSVNTNLLTGSFTGHYQQKLDTLPSGKKNMLVKIARGAQMAPMIAAHDDMFSDEQHLVQVWSNVGAAAALSEFFGDGPHQEMMEEMLPKLWPAPRRRPEWLDQVAPGITDDDAGIGRWWIDGMPRECPGELLIPALAKPVTAAVSRFLKPRRNRLDMPFYGACVNQATDYWWQLIGGDAECFTWRLEPDYLILTSMVVEGLLVRQREALGPLWRFWTELRERVEAKGHKMLERSDIEGAEKRAGITLLRLLPVHATFPPEWEKFFRDPQGFTTWNPNEWPQLDQATIAGQKMPWPGLP